MKMILADDEPIITRGIRKLVDWEGMGIEVVGCYENGKQAMDGILRLNPDLALLDISMPEMSGIDILKECKTLNLSVSIIFISGFQDFEYAKAALRYGAEDYLLKPVLKEELLNAVTKCMNKKNRYAFFEAGELPVRTDQMDYEKITTLDTDHYRPVLAGIIFGDQEPEQIRRLTRFSLVSFLDDYLSRQQTGICFVRKEKIVLILKGDTATRAREQLKEIRAAAAGAVHHEIVMIMGQQVEAVKQIPGEYHRCLEMEEYLFFADFLKAKILTTGETVFSFPMEETKLNEAREKLIHGIVSQDTEGFAPCYQWFSQMVCYMADGKKEDACFYYCSTLRMLEERFSELNLAGCKPDMKLLLEESRTCQSFGALSDKFKLIFFGYINKIQETVTSQEKRSVIHVIEYIEKHYKQDLTLQVLADEIHMNPYYFSVFFKKNTGENFKTYVNKVRMKHAMALLLGTNMKTYEIAEATGYKDPRTFTEVFCKIYRDTPNNYRKKASADNQKPEGKKHNK